MRNKKVTQTEIDCLQRLQQRDRNKITEIETEINNRAKRIADLVSQLAEQEKE